MIRIARTALFLAALSAAALSPPALAQELGAGDREAIRAVIERQIAAFRRDDAAAAFSFASPAIRERFQTPARFMEMVREGYRPVYRPRSVEFQEIHLLQGEPVQQVLVLDPEGAPVIALYFMERQPDGSWRINGCQLLRPRGDSI